MKKKYKFDGLRFSKGTLVWDIFLLPTIRIQDNCGRIFITLEWFKFYIGIVIYLKLRESD